MTCLWRIEIEHPLFKVPFLPIGSPNQAQECPEKMPHRASKAIANLQLHRFPKETCLQLNETIREKTNLKKMPLLRSLLS
jgi:hypothetical protein